ncbi:RHS repeat-associated core domain-containing protein [Chitinophaga sancti]|uniref:RHS repeat-associated core domain-containing protein n=1 Tax=Chitinophaga sancti TaxID=1004 RepID=UPI002A74B168|nr:RHS repeat-associated core domain-containing protein [Chitinophaga sancti]WPQ66295.1 RHS repeat-associated core domain-containing protein [Chitinophaga sancti]
MVANKGLDSINNSWTNAFTALSDFKEAVTYDGNGNILTYNRNGNKTFAGSPLGMDSLTYHYRFGTNKLSYVTDLVRGANYGNDIDNQSIGNYKYDSIGNMVSDVRAGVDSIKWNVYGKIARIYKHDTTSIVYAYDAAGNRISKSVISKTQDTVQTFYVRDATGNILSTYTYRDTSVNSGQLSQIEANLYGSSRLGMTTLATNVQDATPTPTTSIIGLGYGENITFTRGKKFFELTNHLGNVLATVSDRKIGLSLDSSRISHYNPVITFAQEYYPFGMLMPGRGGHIGTGRNVAGSTVVMNGDTIPATLTVTQRTNNTPGTYMATQVISFEGEFASGAGDELTTLFVDQTSADPGTESGISYGIASKGYRYGFNGKENDNEVKGEGNQLNFGARVYDPRIGKWFSVDKVVKSDLSPYQYGKNDPIINIDADGNDEIYFNLLTSNWVYKPAPGRNRYFVTIYQINNHKLEEVHREFFPHNPKSHSGLTRTDMGLLGDVRDVDATTLAKFVQRNPSIVPFLSVSGNKADYELEKYVNVRNAFSKLEDGVNTATATAAVIEGGYGLFRSAGLLKVFSFSKVSGIEASVSVASAAGGKSAPMSIERIIKRGEKLEDIVNEAKGLTWTTGNEHAVVTLTNGERALVSGGPGGIIFKRSEVKLLFGHTHPTSAPPSSTDATALTELGQTKQYVYHGGEISVVRPK